MSILLKGYSGCALQVVALADGLYVKKTSPDTAYNVRLQRQKEKQETLRLKGFSASHIVSGGMENGRYSFVMEYIHGASLAEWMWKIQLTKIEGIVLRIAENFIMTQDADHGAASAFSGKIAGLKQKIRIQDGSGDMKTVAAAFQKLEQYDWNRVIHSPCHGDMTLENILVQDGNLVLIDFLDSFYDSWMIDAAKLLQDAELMWSFRNGPINSNLLVRLTVFRDLLLREIARVDRTGTACETVYHILLLHILRIFPYVTNQKDSRFLEHAAAQTLRKIDAKGWAQCVR